MRFKNIISYLAVAIIMCFVVSAAVYSGTIDKGKWTKSDMALWTGTSSTEYERETSTDYTLTLPYWDHIGVDVLQVYGGNVNANKATLQSALTAIETVNERLIWMAPSTWDIDDDVTITSNITTKIPPGCLLQVAAGKTLTIDGPFNAGLYQVFSGAGTVVFGTGSCPEAYSEWWGIDGTADNTEISEAIAATSTAKIPVALTKSAYTVSGSITMLDKSMIYAKNRSTVTLADNTDADLFLITGDDVTIKDIIAVGNKANQTEGSFILIDAPGGSIDNLHVENCEISNFKEYGIQVEETCANHTYINNKIDSCDKSGILVSPGVADTSDNIRIEGNHVISSGVNGIQVYNSTNVNNTNIFIIGNYVLSTAVVPIEIQRAKWGVISNNIVRSGTNGISVGSCQYATVTGNVVEDQTYWGIELADIDEGGNIVVDGNEVYNCGVGIIASAPIAAYGTGVVITNNVIDTTTVQEGIEIKCVSEAVISGNVIKDPEVVGIRINGWGAATDISDISVTNNVIRFTAALSAGLVGISCQGVDGGKISDNLIITEVPGSNEYDALIALGTYNTNLYITDNVLLGTTAIVARGIYDGLTTNDNIYILRNSIKNMKVGIQTSPNTNPEVTISDNIIEGSSSADITAHASHKLDQIATSPTQGSLWFVGDVAWETAPTAGNTPGWSCVSRVKTEFRIAGVALDTVLEVDATAGMVAGDIIGVEQDDGTWHWTTIANVNDADTVTITVGLVSAAAIDNDIVSNLWKAMANLAA